MDNPSNTEELFHCPRNARARKINYILSYLRSTERAPVPHGLRTEKKNKESLNQLRERVLWHFEIRLERPLFFFAGIALRSSGDGEAYDSCVCARVCACARLTSCAQRKA